MTPMTTTGAGAAAPAGAGAGAGAGGRTPPVLRLYHDLLADRERLIAAHHRLLAEQNALLEQIDLLCARSTAEAGLDPPCDSAPALSPVQRQVLVLMAGGAKDGAIARRLNLSERSVRRQVESLTQRTGASNRFTLALAAIRIGWLPAGR